MEELTPTVFLKLLFEVIRNLLRYPLNLFRKIYWADEPSSFFGLTDHPLDRWGGPIVDIFTAIRKFTCRRATSILQVEFKDREDNSFFFKAKGYNVYLIRDMRAEAGGHRYLTKGKRYKACLLCIDILQPKVYRLRLVKGDKVPEHRTEMIYEDIRTETDVDFTEEEAFYRIRTGDMSLHIYRDEFRIEVRDGDGSLITETGSKTKDEFPHQMDAWPLGFIYDKGSGRTYGVDSFVLYPGEAVYGFGEKFSALNKVGQNIGVWTCEGLGNTTWRAYKHVPFFLSTRGYGVFVNESKPVNFWVGTREICRNIMAVESDLLDYYFFCGEPKEVLDKYTDLTGKPPVPPKWSFGTWLSRCSSISQDEVIGVAQKLREMEFPSDVIHIDVGWFTEDWRCDWRFDRNKFPDPAAMFSQLRAMGFRACLWQIPYIIDDMEIMEEAREKGALAANNGPFFFLTYPAHAIDLSKPEAVEWYQGKLRSLFELGASAIKVDFGEGIERHQVFEGYSGSEMHNLYPLLYNRAVFEATRDYFGDAVIWARSAYAGSQRYPVHWSGDSSCNFENMLCTLRGGLSLGMCGFTFWAQDCGGFIGVPSDKLYTRWTQFSIFNSHIRFHGLGPRYREPWRFEPRTQDIVREMLNLRYRLIPYIYSEAHYMAAHGLPLLCPLVLEFWEDPTVYNIEDSYLFGRNLLVAPILTEEDERNIYIPHGTWYDFWTDESQEGPCWIKYRCPLERVPLFVREGTVLPLAALTQHTGDIELDEEVTLKVYPDAKGRADYVLTDDEHEYEVKAVVEDGILNVSAPSRWRKVKVEFPQISGVEDFRLIQEA